MKANVTAVPTLEILAQHEGWLRALIGNLTWGSTKAKVFTPAKVIVKETTRPQHFEVEIDAAQLRQALGELDAWLARIKAAQRRR